MKDSEIFRFERGAFFSGELMYSIEKIGDKYILKGHAYNGFKWMQDVDLEKIMVLNFEGIQFEFEIEDYRPSTRDHWDDEWCVVTAKAIGGVLNYSIHSSCMCYCKVEWLYKNLEKLANGSITEVTEVSSVGPDFEFMLYPSDKGSYYMEWKFNFWDGGVLTCNSFTLTFVDEDIQELMK